RHRAAMLDGQAATGQVDHQTRTAVLREPVPVYGDLGAHGDLAPHPGVQGGRVVAGLGHLVVQRPGPPELVQRLHHRGNPNIVVVLADGAGTGLLEVREPGRLQPVEHLLRHTLGVLVVPSVTSRIGTGVGARRHHPQRRRRTRVGVAYL